MASHYNDARGAALVAVLLMMGLLTLLGTTYLTIASTEHTVASNEANTARAFNIAEAGLERAKARIRNGTEALNQYLPGGNPGPGLGIGTVAFDGGNYTIVVEDDLGLPADTNDRVLIRATGRFNNNTVQKEVAALVEVVRGSPPPPIPPQRGAAESLTTSGGTVEVHGEPGNFDGRNFTNLPPVSDMPSVCSSNPNCGGPPGAAVTYGGYSNKPSASFNVSGPPSGTMFGIGCLPPQGCNTDSGPLSKNTAPGPGTDLTVAATWDTFIDAAKLQADQILDASAVSSGTPPAWGTETAPQVTVINGSGMLNWGATIKGAGVLIVDGAAGTSGSGSLNWQGLVIFRNTGEVQFGNTMKVRIFGQLVVRTTTGNAEIELKTAGSFVRYSSDAMDNMVPQAFGPAPSFTVRNWQERAVQ